jgi:hypothetical protein
VLLLLPATLVAQHPIDAEDQKSNPIYQAYQEQLKQNQRRLSSSDDAYQQQFRKNQAAQVYMPPVHIAPPVPPHRSRPNRSLNGRFNTVQDYAAPHKPTQVSLSDQRKNVRPKVPTKALPKRVAQSGGIRADVTSSTEHVFLQDRIANALSRTFGRKSNSSDLILPSPSPEADQRDVPSFQKNQKLDRPLLGSVELEQYASDNADEWYKDANNPLDDQQPAHSMRNADSLNSVLDRLEGEKAAPATKAQPTEFELAEAIPPRVFVPKNPIQDASRVVRSSYEVKRNATRVAKRTRRLKAPRPVKYRQRANQLRAGEVSILVGQEKEESLEDLDFDLPLDEDGRQNSLSDEEFSSPLRPKADSGTKPDQRDDLETVKDSDLDSDRIRSRLDEELDEMDDLDDIDEEDFGDDEPQVERPTERPCNEFRDELLSTSIRDISLDISPGAYSETARYGGLSRSWTDRSGNVIANGTMVDLRRGYVILDGGQKIPYAKLGASDLAAVSEFWRLPSVCLLGNRGGSPYRCWTPQTVTWKASSLCHKPLYFENRQLERYGHSRGPFAQPIHSTVHFFASLISLPYQTAITPANECQYALGFFRPGDCAPWLKDPIPISLAGARRQALLTTGGAFIP